MGERGRVSRPGFDGDLDSQDDVLAERGFCPAMSRPKKYPDELVRRGIRLALESGRPTAHIAADLGMHPETPRKKVRQAECQREQKGATFGISKVLHSVCGPEPA